jgi:hypothetical protein
VNHKDDGEWLALDPILEPRCIDVPLGVGEFDRHCRASHRQWIDADEWGYR